MMMKRLSLLVLVLVAALREPPRLQGQSSTWSLPQCVDYALGHNLQMKQAELTKRNAELSLRQSQLSRLPSVNGQSSLGNQFGRTVDPTTNAFNTERITFNSFSINAGVVLFDGNRINTQVEQSKLDLQAATLDQQASANDIALLVANTYLTILLAEEQATNARRRLELSRAQLAQLETFIRTGARPANDRFELEATVARNEQLLIESNNLVAINYLSLKQLLQLDPATPFQLEAPAVALPEGILSQEFALEELFVAALSLQPQILAAEQRLRSAELGEKLSRAGLWPTLTLFGNLNTSYSSAFRDFLNPDLSNVVTVPNPAQTVLVNDVPVSITTFRQEGVVYPRTEYFSQLNNNFGQSLGLSLRVPIYNNHLTRTAIERARLGVTTAGIQRQQQRDQLKANVQRALTDLSGARESYRAAQRSFEAAQTSYNNVDRRYTTGGANNFELTTAANSLDQARTELSRAKYQLLFNWKVVEFYQGKPLDR